MVGDVKVFIIIVVVVVMMLRMDEWLGWCFVFSVVYIFIFFYPSSLLKKFESVANEFSVRYDDNQQSRYCILKHFENNK